ncbi:MAG: hypothetical protein AAF502_12745 [Bacteroidota bacterium]
MKQFSIPYALLFCVFLYSCKGETDHKTPDEPKTEVVETNKNSEPIPPDEPEAPALPEYDTAPSEGYDLLGKTEGDLNKDGVVEKVYVYNTPDETEFGTARQIIVLKVNDQNEWEEWLVSNGGVLPSEHGGIKGDPFQSIRVERGCIVVEHYGGSRWEWTYTHRFRFQNEKWELIGTTITNGAACEYYDEYDYNLSNGNINYTRTNENCDIEGTPGKPTKETAALSHKISPLPVINDFYPGNTEVKLEGTDNTFYF